jgi:hypothetical protein
MTAPLNAQLSDNDCRNNCGDFTGDCRACHLTSDAAQWFVDYTYICPDCSPTSAKTQPKIPFRAAPMDSVVAFLGSMTVKRDPKLERLMAMTPERHIVRMEPAVRLKLDGAMLGDCRKAFKPGTLLLLPGEIRATRARLLASDIPLPLCDCCAGAPSPCNPNPAPNPCGGDGQPPCFGGGGDGTGGGGSSYAAAVAIAVALAGKG